MDLRLSFTTQAFLDLKNPFEILVVTRKDDKVDYHTEPIPNRAVIARYKLDSWNLIAENFEFKKYQKLITQHKENYEKLGLSTGLTAYVNQYMTKYVFDTFQQIRRNFWECKITFKHQFKEGNIRNIPLSINFHEPRLRFEVMKDEDGKLHLKKYVYLEEDEYAEKDVEIFEFLIIKGTEYFVFNNTDFQTLTRLKKIDFEKYHYDAVGFSEEILMDLEKKYAVERHKHFPEEHIEVEPSYQLYLTESSDFLMLHPQYNYDDIVIEGAYKPENILYKNGVKIYVKRSQEKESEFTKEIQSTYADFEKQLNGYYFLSVSEAKKKNWFLNFYHNMLTKNVAIIGMDMLRNFRYSSFAIETKYSILGLENNLLSIQFKVNFGEEVVDNLELQKALQAKQKSILLSDNTIGVLTDEWLEKFGLLVKHSRIQKDILSVPKWILIFNRTLSEFQDSSQEQVIEEDWWEKWNQWQNSEAIINPISNDVKATLRPYQQKGFEWMVLLSKIGAGACLADDMGLGKTLQTICFLDYKKKQSPNTIQLIISPSSLMYNWKVEIEKFAPELKTHVYHQSNRNIEDLATNQADILITSYGTARADIELLEGLQFSTIVLDESHNIKNPTAQVSKAVLRLQADSKVILSGTPIMNNTLDLFPQLSFIVPQLFGSQEFFSKEYVHPIDRDKDKEKIEQLKRVTSPFVLRRTKEQVAKDLPSKTESIIWCEMGGAQKRYYNEVKDNIKNSLFVSIKSEGLGKSKMNVLAGIQKLRQLCSSPVPIEDYEHQTEESIKIDTLIEELEGNLVHNKVIVFSQFLGALDKIGQQLKVKEIAYYLIDGSTPQIKRQEQINKFQDKENPVRVFLLSLKAGNSGFTLTEANYVFLIDPWWNRQVENQAIDRVYRIGQDKNVFAYRMICKDTIEEKIIQLQTKKLQLSEELISEDEGFVKNLNEEDIEFLFG
ncbi:MAG: ATP-dependent helicase [Chitinophagales bacterium]|nr:ATP-dependent helicase [Chitinophagales bacterium]